MKKFILFIFVYTLYFCSIPVFFFSNQEKIANGKLIVWLQKWIPKEWITDKLFHFSFFFASVILLYILHRFIIKSKSKIALLTIFIILSIVIVAIEYIQPYFNRSFEFADIIYGVLGVSLATNGLFFITKK